jgi:hypothetical protein
VFVEGNFVFVGEGVKLPGQAVTRGVDAGAFFAFFSSGAGGFLGVLPVGFKLCVSNL